MWCSNNNHDSHKYRSWEKSTWWRQANSIRRIKKIIRIKSWKLAKINSWRAGNEEGLCKMGCVAAGRRTTPELLWSLCYEAILRELRWILLSNPRIKPDLASSDFQWFGLFIDPLRAENSGVKVNWMRSLRACQSVWS